MNLNNFGITTRTGVEQTDLSKRITVTEAISSEKEEQKGWREAEAIKSYALDLIQRAQNC